MTPSCPSSNPKARERGAWLSAAGACTAPGRVIPRLLDALPPKHDPAGGQLTPVISQLLETFQVAGYEGDVTWVPQEGDALLCTACL